MTAKQFFKSVTFKCIITLLCVLLVSGIFLTVMNSLLKVTDQEKFDRAIQKIYGKAVTTESVQVENYDSAKATINEAYKVLDDGNYLIKATGKGGYDNGTVTCWIVVAIEKGAVAGIDKVVIDSNVGQSYIDRVSSKALDQFSELYEEGITYSASMITAATVMGTKSAICNAVNIALDFANAMCGNVITDIIKDNNFAYISNIDTRNTSYHINDDNTVTYNIKTSGYGMAGEFIINVTVGAGGIITNYEIVKNGSTDDVYEDSMDSTIKDGSWFVNKTAQDILDKMGGSVDIGSISGGLSSNQLSTGATQSTYQCIQAAVFASANYQLCLELGNLFDSTDGGEENEQV